LAAPKKIPEAVGLQGFLFLLGLTVGLTDAATLIIIIEIEFIS
jgi:hypothetical protein